MIPATMKAFQFMSEGKAGVLEVPVPELKDANSILIKNDAAIICNMTDTHIYEGVHEPNGPSGWDMPLPCTMGHESSGIVVKKGSNVTNVELGDRVALCGWFESGSFAQYTMASAGYIKVSNEMSGAQGALVEMLSCVYLIVDQVFTIGESVVLMGAGAAGTLGLKLVKAGGATKIIVVEPHPGKREYALANGAHYVIDPETEDVAAKVREYTNGKMVDVVMEFSGYPKSLAVMNSCVRRGGKIGLFGVCPQPTTVNMYDLHMNWATIVTAGYKRGYTEYVQEKAVEMIEAGVVNLDDMITHKVKLDDVEAAFRMIQKGEENIRKVLIEL